MPSIRKIAPCLWYDGQAEEAARFYVSVFESSEIVRISHYGEAGKEHHGREPGSVMTVDFRLDGRPFTAMNGGPAVRFNWAVSLQIFCDTQEEIDHFWNRLPEGGGTPNQCGWVQDRFGLSWQVVPTMLPELMAEGGPPAQRAFAALMGMTKIDIATLQAAAAGE